MPTLWGLNVTQLHDRFWLSRRAHVVRHGSQERPAAKAHWYMLIPQHALILFEIQHIEQVLNWINPQVTCLVLQGKTHRAYDERVIERDGILQAIERSYDRHLPRRCRILLTRDRALAQQWSQSRDLRATWRSIRLTTPEEDGTCIETAGQAFTTTHPADVHDFLHTLIRTWPDPQTTVSDITQLRPQVMTARNASCDAKHTLVGPIWMGRERCVPEDVLVGPALLWDAGAQEDDLVWTRPEALRTCPADTAEDATFAAAQRSARWYHASKRLFDVGFALTMLTATLPLYPAIMLAIALEDGPPFFFGHRRQTRGGRTFSCLKFRSMRKDAEQIKSELAAKNQADGPQFFMDEDPRLTRVGKLLRKFNLDELPQFINVLAGDMSVVGPRPSPDKENQYCPTWREARLSVLPGITGLWQVQRSRQPGQDFQEWIRYDLEYVERANWRMDLDILRKTILMILCGRQQAGKQPSAAKVDIRPKQ